jgi:DNA-binding response OmpR family regulator
VPHAVLVIEDEAILAKNIALYLGRSDYEVRIADSAEAGLVQLDEFRPDAVVLDFNLPGLDGLQALARIHAFDPAVRVVMITGHGSVEMAVQAIKAGAYDFLTKPVALSKLRLVLEKAFGDSRRDGALAYYQRRDAESALAGGLLGESPPMRELKSKLQQLLRAESQMRGGDAPGALVLGETGSGKELVARALHFNGPRRDKPFVELNCAALPAQLLESELFGHERGAFTDARDRKLGLVETAEGGTLFLDEIGDLDIALQAKLLKLLEDKTVRRIGSLREQKVDVRIVAATHQRWCASSASAPTCTFGSAWCNCVCRRCASVAATSCCWRSTSCSSTRSATASRRPHLPPARPTPCCATPGPATCANCATCSSRRCCCMPAARSRYTNWRCRRSARQARPRRRWRNRQPRPPARRRRCPSWSGRRCARRCSAKAGT